MQFGLRQLNLVPRIQKYGEGLFLHYCETASLHGRVDRIVTDPVQYLGNPTVAQLQPNYNLDVPELT
jgi:hypothetical protein